MKIVVDNTTETMYLVFPGCPSIEEAKKAECQFQPGDSDTMIWFDDDKYYMIQINNYTSKMSTYIQKRPPTSVEKLYDELDPDKKPTEKLEK
jgi:hypothetical protein